MMYDIQRANMWKRISAYIVDLIFLIIIAVGVASVLSHVLSYNEYYSKRNDLRTSYEDTYDVDFDISEEDYTALSENEKSNFDAAYEAFISDSEVNKLDSVIVNLILIIISFSFLISYLILEIIIPCFFKNGQTVGKKVFGIAVMREDCVKASTFQIIVRVFLGKFTIETMLPIFLVLIFFFNIMPLFCLVALLVLLIGELILIFATRLHTPIHDLISGCVCVDVASQMIFPSKSDLIEYTKKIHAENAEKAEYR